jgi:hypothetical protein
LPRYRYRNHPTKVPSCPTVSTHVIDQLFTSEPDRALARAWTAKLDADGLGDRTEVLIREAAATAKRGDGTERAQAQAREYLADFAKTIGVPEHHVASSMAWLDEAPSETAAPGSKLLPPSDNEIERRMARQEADKIEEVMRTDPQRYWRSPDMQSKYHDALERSIAPPLAPVEQGPSATGAPTSTQPTSTEAPIASQGAPAEKDEGPSPTPAVRDA